MARLNISVCPGPERGGGADIRLTYVNVFQPKTGIVNAMLGDRPKSLNVLRVFADDDNRYRLYFLISLGLHAGKPGVKLINFIVKNPNDRDPQRLKHCDPSQREVAKVTNGWLGSRPRARLAWRIV